MSHHADEQDPEMAERLQKVFKEAGSSDILKQFTERAEEALQVTDDMVGPTNEYPAGKLTEKDKGGIRFDITTQEDKIILNFYSPVQWLGLTAEDAFALGKSLIRRADAIMSGE